MKEQEMPPQWKEFLKDFDSKFDAKKETGCDYHNCTERLNPRQIQVFTMPDLEIKVFCFQHLLATLFKLDNQKFQQLVDENYPPIKRGAIKMYFEMNYSN